MVIVFLNFGAFKLGFDGLVYCLLYSGKIYFIEYDVISTAVNLLQVL